MPPFSELLHRVPAQCFKRPLHLPSPSVHFPVLGLHASHVLRSQCCDPYNLFRSQRMSRNSTDFNRRDVRAQSAARRDEDTAAQATSACQDPNMLMVLEATGTDAVSYALDVSSLDSSLSLLSSSYYSTVWWITSSLLLGSRLLQSTRPMSPRRMT